MVEQNNENHFLMYRFHPENILLKIQGKTVRLQDSDWLSDFGIGNGERIEIVIGEGGES